MAYDKDYEEYESWKSKKQRPWNRFIKNLEPKHYIGLVFLVGFMFVVYSRSPDKNLVLIVGVGVLAIIIFFVMKSGENKPITREQAMLIVEESLKSDIPRIYPTGTDIQLTPYCELNRIKDEWDVGARIIYPDKLIKEIMVAVNPYTGDIVKTMATPTGYDATETSELRPIYSYPSDEPPEGYLEE